MSATAEKWMVCVVFRLIFFIMILMFKFAANNALHLSTICYGNNFAYAKASNCLCKDILQLDGKCGKLLHNAC